MRASRSSSQRGFSLIAAVFLIVVLAVLGAFAVRIGSTQQQTVSLSIAQARALAAANTGIEFGSQQVLNGGNCGTTTLVLTEMSLSGFTVKVGCTAVSHTALTLPKTSYALDAVAHKGAYGTPDYVSRHVTRTVTTP